MSQPETRSSPVLLSEDRGAVRTLTMNRPDKRNALDTELTTALLHALEHAGADDAIGAVVLAGAGHGFCAGADLDEFRHLTPENQHLVTHRADLTCRLHMALQNLPKPVVSAAHGAAVGGGAGLAIGCDMMVASTDLKFGYPELRHSIVPAIVMTGLQRQVGRKLAFELISTGRFLTGQEMFNLGLANRLAGPGDVLETAIALAVACAEASRPAMQATKELFYRVADLPYAAAMAAGRDVNTIMRGFRSGSR